MPIRRLSTEIQQNISSQVLWGDRCSDKWRDGFVDGRKITNSGIPDFILIKDDKDIHDIQDVFDDLQDIREYATNHSKIRASFLAQNYIWESEKNCWTTQGKKRNLAVWVNWYVDKKGKLCGVLVFDNPLAESEGVLKNFKSCLEKMGIPNDQKFRLEMLHGRICDDIPVKQ